MVKMAGVYTQTFLKIIKIVDDHKSTLGYEILNEPQYIFQMNGKKSESIFHL